MQCIGLGLKNTEVFAEKFFRCCFYWVGSFSASICMGGGESILAKFSPSHGRSATSSSPAPSIQGMLWSRKVQCKRRLLGEGQHPSLSLQKQQQAPHYLSHTGSVFLSMIFNYFLFSIFVLEESLALLSKNVFHYSVSTPNTCLNAKITM